MATPFQHPSINWSASNQEEEWKKFKQHADLVFQGPLIKASEAEKCAYLLIWVGEKGRQIFNSWNLPDGDEKKFNVISSKFKEHTAPRKNTVFSRYRFHQRVQQSEDTTETFVTDLRILVKDCAYRDPDDMVRDRIVFGTNSNKVREKLLNEGDDLNLEKAVEIAMTFEITQKHLQSMASSLNPNNIDVIERNQRPNLQHQRDNEVVVNCRNCGNKHGRKSCPAYGKQCNYCKKLNHFANVCMTKKKNDSRNNQAVHNIHDSSDTTDETCIIDSIYSSHDPNTVNIDSITDRDLPDTIFANIETDTGSTIRFKIDSGAQANVLSVETYKKLKRKPPIHKCSIPLFGYANHELVVRGFIIMKCRYRDLEYTGRFFVVEAPSNALPLLGSRASLFLKVIKICSIDEIKTMTKESVLDEYDSTFKGLGELEGEIDISLDDKVNPAVHAPRRVPHAIKSQLKENLDKMEESGVIKKVTCPTDWVNSLVVVEKPNGKLRVCLDPKDLNAAVKRPHYPMPTLEDALAKMPGAKFFSKLDAFSGYWQLKLSETSSYLTTFNTPFGRYRFTRLPFGLVSAQDEFQRKMDEVFEGLPGVTPLIDDVIVSGRTRKEHDVNLRAALDRARDKNLKLNPEKLEVGVQEVAYFGHLITSEGLRPDPEKVEAIKNMPPPTDKKELKTVLGMINFLAKFAPKLSEITKPMRDLLKEDVVFVWDDNQQSSFQMAKDTISNQPVLAYFDPVKEVTLETDASKYGLGATLLQEGKPVAFASKSLSQTEQNYAQIEKELYAIVFGCQRFHQYLYGRTVNVRSDHKPLESIARKPLASAPPRLQRMLLQLQKYNIQINHVPGKDIPIADALSRSLIEQDDHTENPFFHVHAVLENLPISDNKTEELKTETKRDLYMQEIMKHIMEGWPMSRKECPTNIVDMWNHRDELSVIDGLVFKAGNIVVPPSMRPEMLQKLHTGHLGREKTKQRARGILFWPGMSAQLDDLIESCPVCNAMRPSQAKEPLISHQIPDRPWKKIATDIFTWSDRHFMVTVDYYSRFFEIDELNSLTSGTVIRKLKAIFARYGIPEELVSDNGPQYTSVEFNSFSEKWDFKHVTSSPGYPQSNGLAEKTVQTAKRILTKASADPNTDPFLALLEYRTTPVDNLASPSELLMSRQLRSILPTSSQPLYPRPIEPETVISQRQNMQSQQRYYYNQGAHSLPQVQKGDPVYVQVSKQGTWVPAQVTAQSDTPRSFVVQTENGSNLRRNQRFIRKRAVPIGEKLQNVPPTSQQPAAVPDIDTSPPPHSGPHDGTIQNDCAMNSPSPIATGTTRSGRVIKAPDKLNL